MVIPAIDFQSHRVVQLVQGERLALERELEETLAAFAGFPWLQVIDLDAAKGEGSNRDLIRRCCRAGFRVRAGGGIRSRAAAEEILAWGAERVILGSAAYAADGVNTGFLRQLEPLGRERLILAVDSREHRVAIEGWRRLLPLTPAEALRQAEGLCAEFLYTHVDTEGLMQGTSLSAVRELRAATRQPISVAGGIASLEEIAALEALGCDAVLGMAIYTGKLSLASLRALLQRSGGLAEKART
ncbi:MAG: HisA/HisF-related TIM barrel protein [Terriglobales bacterium]